MNGSQRGTSAREDILDTSILLSRPDGYDPSSPCHFKLEFTKARAFYGDDAQPLDIELREDDKGAPVLTYGEAIDPKEQAREQNVKVCLDMRRDGKSIRKIAAATGISVTAVQRICKGPA